MKYIVKAEFGTETFSTRFFALRAVKSCLKAGFNVSVQVES